MTEQLERRKFPRLFALVDVFYEKEPPQEKEKLTLTKNISKGGICLIAYEELKKDEILNLKIYLPDEELPVVAKGRVAWAKEFIIGDYLTGRRFDVGIEFIEINDSDLEKINRYIFAHI